MIGLFSPLAILLLGVAGATCTQTPPVQMIHPNDRFSNMTLEIPAQDFPIIQSAMLHPPDCGERSYKGSGRLKGMKALITGGDSGIGRAVAIAYVREGAEVAINYLPEEEEDAQDLADFLSQEGVTIKKIPGNLLNETFCTHLVQEAHRQLGGLDILVNNAGASGNLQGPNWRPIDQMESEELQHLYRVNVWAPLYLTRAAVPLMRPGASIIVTSSGLVANPVATSYIYGSTKAALTHTVRTLSQQLVPRGIRVNAIAPPLTYTPFLATGGFPNEMLSTVSERLHLGRLAQPVETSPFYVDAADPTRTHLTGEVIAVLGGDLGF